MAVPGAGKTFWTLHTGRELIKAGRIQRIVIVGPTIHQKPTAEPPTNWGSISSLTTRTAMARRPVDCDGVAMNYHQMHEQRSLHRQNISGALALVVLDERHHLQDKASWGEAALEAFDMAAYRIHLSGTPWNKEGFIPWITYDVEGRPMPDDMYSYQDSLTDGVNCDVFFPNSAPRSSGSSTAGSIATVSRTTCQNGTAPGDWRRYWPCRDRISLPARSSKPTRS